MKYCSTCSLEYPDASSFCKVCGEKLEATAPPGADGDCPSCGAAVVGGWRFCKQCGQTLNEDTIVRERPASPAQMKAEAPAGVATVTPTAAPAFTPTHVPRDYHAPAAPAAMGEQCRACGHQNEAGAAACEVCGTAVGLYARKRRVKKGVTAALIVLCVGFLIAGLAGVGWYLLGVSVAIQTDPGNSKIIIDGEDVGQTNEYGALLTRRFRAGDHTLTVMHDGYDSWTQDFNIALTDLSKSLNIKLNLTKYKLKIISSPPGSEVLVDNSPVGSTSKEGGVLETAPLTPGVHTVVVRADGYREWKQGVDLKADTTVEVTLSAAPVVNQDTSSEGEVRSALDGWAQSIQNRDIDAHMRYYADTLDYYYARSTIQSSRVRDDRMKAFQKFNWLSVQLANINVQLDSTGQRATVVFDKTFDFRGEGGNFFSGSVQNHLTLTKLGGAWLITGEKELKVYDVKSSSNQ